MSSTDDRIVRMQFDNAQFRKGAIDTQKSLADLNKSVDAAGKNKGLLDLNQQMGTVGVTASKMAIVTTTALATIANKATNVALEMARSMTLDPIRAGFSEYEALLTKQNVIMNATGLSAKVVKGYLNELNHYSDQTIYSFSNMTDSITKFVNAGVDMPTAIVSIKGIANAAAFAGASTQEANRAMYAFSQSMQTGFIMLNDWMQIENANMGTIAFKEELLKAGVAAGTLTKRGNEFITSSGRAISATKGWRDGLQDQWATTEVLNSALGKYADTSTKLGKTAFESATQVRTFSAFMDTLKESLGSGWAQIFTALVGNLKQATSFWTGVSNAVGDAVGNIFEFGVTALKTWRKMGGFEKTIQGLKNIMAPFAAILDVIGDAWKEAFPGTSSGAGKALYGLSAGFEAVTRPLQWLADLIRGTTPVLEVFFKILRIGGTAIGRVAGQIADFVSDLLGLANIKAPSGSSGFLGFIKDIGKAIANAVDQIDDLLSKGASLGAAFGAVDINLPSMPSLPSLPSLPSFGGGEESAVAGIAGGIKGLTQDVLGLNKAADDTESNILFTPNAKLDTSRLSDYGDSAQQMASDVANSGDEVKSVFVKIGAFVSDVASGILNFFKSIDMEDVMRSINFVAFNAFMYQVIRMMVAFRKGFSGFMGIGDSISGVFDSLAGSLKSFQTQAYAKLVLNFGIALGILAAALLVLSLIPYPALVKALGAVALTMLFMQKMLTSLMDTLGDMEVEKIAKISGAMVALGFAMMSLGVAMILLATAFTIFNLVKWDAFAKGIGTMIVLMTGMTLMSKYMGDNAKSLLAASVAMIALGGALVLLAGAMIMFGLVKPESMVKAGLALGAMVVAFILLAKVPWPALAAAGAAMFGVAAGMLVLVNALILFALVKWESIAKAAVVLGALVISLMLLQATGGPATAAAFMGLAASILMISVALIALNAVDWSSIGKLAVVLTVLIVAAAAFFAVLYLAAPVVPVLFMLSLALLALSAAVLLFAAAMAVAITLGAAGTAAFAALAVGAAVAITTFMQTLAAEAPIMKDAFLSILQTLIDTIVEAVPMVIDGLRRLFEAIGKELTKPATGKKAGEAGKSWIESMADGLIKKIPLIVAKANEIIIAFLRGLSKDMADIAAAGAEVVIQFIEGLGRKAEGIVQAAVNLIVKFADAIGKNNQKILQAGIDLIADFLHDLADAIRNGSQAIGGGLSDVVDAMRDVGVDMIEGLIGGIGSMFDSALSKVSDLANQLAGKMKDLLKINSPSKVFYDIGKFIVQGLTQGIQKNAAAAIVSTAAMITGQIALANEYVSRFVQRMEQKAIAAQAKAEGLARAALKAQKAAEKTKTKEDDKAAKKAAKRAEKARKEAEEAKKRAEAAERAQDRKETWQKADSAKRAEIRAQDAQRNLDAAKSAEQNAEALRQEANALDALAKNGKFSKKEREAFRKEADRLRKQAREEAQRANNLLNNAQASAADALKYQQLAGQEAADYFQEQFEAQAKADQEAEAFEKMTDAEKAAKRREQAARLEQLAAENLAKAKELAFTDLEAANALAQQAMDQADLARQYIDEAMGYEATGGGAPYVDLQMSEAAAAAFQQFTDMYDAAVAAAAAAPTVEFTQNNYSPEALPASEIYRNTNNQLTHAADKLVPSAA